jgi:GTP-binding protein Era
MRDAAIAAAQDADIVLLLVDATDRRGRTPERHAQPDAIALSESSKQHPIVIGLNKVDRVAKPELLPVIELWQNFAPGVEVVPFSAMTGENVDALERVLASKLPVGPQLFPSEQVTDRSPQFIAQEIIREQLYHQLGKELPYACAVQVETWSETPKKELVIEAQIVVERTSQKAIVVGRAGSRIRELGIAARAALTSALGKPVHLKLFVKVIDEWSRAERTLHALGYAGERS